MDTTKFRILEVIIKNRQKSFEDIQVALITEFQEMSWEEICSYLYLLKQDGYIAVLNGDNTILDLAIQPTALARLSELKETTKDNKIKEIITRILQVARVLL